MENTLINRKDSYGGNKNLEEKEDRKISVALMASFVVLTIQYFLLVAFGLLDSGSGAIIQQASKGLVGLLFLYALPIVLKRNFFKFCITYFISIIVFLVHFLFFPENREYMWEILFPFFFMCLPALLFSISINDWNNLKNIMRKSSLIIFFTCLILTCLILFGNASIDEYSMALSYYALLPTIFYLNELVNKFSLKAFFIVFLSLIVILALGSRGAVLCIIVFILLKLLRNIKFGLNYKKAVFIFTSMTTIVFLIIFYEFILSSLYNFLLNFGIESRSIEMFLSGSVSLTSRDIIYIDIINAVSENPLGGIGIAGDRRVIEDLAYAHNIFLELIANFGVVLGFIIILVMIFLILKGLMIKDQKKFDIILMWISIGFIHLFVSNSYLTDFRFWIFIGLVLGCTNLRYYSTKNTMESKN